MLELKRLGRPRVQTGMVEFIALPVPSSKQLKKSLGLPRWSVVKTYVFISVN